MSFAIRSFEKLLFVVLTLVSIQLFASPVSAESRFLGDVPTMSTRKPRLLVFIHGIGNNGIGGVFSRSDNIMSAWRRDDRSPSWPEVFRARETVSTNFDIFIVQYDTARFRNTVSIQSISDDIRNDLNQKAKIADYGEVYFLAHSMGGIVTRDLLLNEDSIRKQTKALFLFSTPMSGSTVAKFGEFFGIVGNQTVQLAADPENPDAIFNTVKLRWISQGITIPTFCAYEKRDTWALRVVSRTSAEPLCTHALEEIDGDHNDVVLPKLNVPFRPQDKLTGWMIRLGIVPENDSTLPAEELTNQAVIANCQGTYSGLGPYRQLHRDLPAFMNARPGLFPPARVSEPLPPHLDRRQLSLHDFC